MEHVEHKEQSGDSARPVEKTPAKKRKKLPSQERLRHELVYQLRESLMISKEKMKNQQLSLAEQEHWTRVHTYTAQILNTVLRDQQFREWERRLKELERQGLIPDGTITSSEP